jgi:hypothetical protein
MAEIAGHIVRVDVGHGHLQERSKGYAGIIGAEGKEGKCEGGKTYNSPPRHQATKEKWREGNILFVFLGVLVVVFQFDLYLVQATRRFVCAA